MLMQPALNLNNVQAKFCSAQQLRSSLGPKKCLRKGLRKIPSGQTFRGWETNVVLCPSDKLCGPGFLGSWVPCAIRLL